MTADRANRGKSNFLSVIREEKVVRFVLLAVFLLAFAASPADATLIDRGGGLIYDDVQDITWLQDANLSGRALWDPQMAWAASLSIYDSVRNVTWDDWRVASISEYQYLNHQYGVSSESEGLFVDVQPWDYWSSTEYSDPRAAYTLNFQTGNGVVNVFVKYSIGRESYAWGVRDGDVAAVPTPSAAWLGGFGLAGTVWWRWWRRKRTVA